MDRGRAFLGRVLLNGSAAAVRGLYSRIHVGFSKEGRFSWPHITLAEQLICAMEQPHLPVVKL